MLTNPRDAFRGQSRIPNSSMLGIVSSCPIVTLSLARADSTSRNVVTLKTGLEVRQGHWKCHHAIERIMTSY